MNIFLILFFGGYAAFFIYAGWLIYDTCKLVKQYHACCAEIEKELFEISQVKEPDL